MRTSGTRRRRRSDAAPRRLQARRAAGFLLAAGLTLVLAFNGGGYDVVIRHQVGIAVWAAIALGLGAGVLPRARLNTATWVALLGLVALAFFTLLSHAWSKSDERTTEELARVLEYLGVVLLAVLTLNRYTWRGAALGFAAGALIVPFFSVGARVFPHLLTDPLAQDFHFDRLSYPLGYWNAVACWGAMAIAVGLCLSANAAREWVRALGLACVPVAALSVYLTYSRFGMAATAIAAIAGVAVSRHRWTTGAHALVAGAASAVVILAARGQPEIAQATGGAGGGTVALLLGGVAVGCGLVTFITSRARLDGVRMDARAARVSLATAGVGLLLAAVALHSPLSTAWEKFKNDKPPPAAGPGRVTSLGSSRYSVWTKADDAFKSDTLRGIGAGNFEFYWSRHADSPEFIRDAHTLYLEQAAELGVPGLLAALTALGGLLWAALLGRARWRRGVEVAAGSAMIGAFVVFLVYAGVDWMWELGAVGTLALGGAAVAGAGGLERVGESAISPWVRAAAVVAALLAGAVQVPGLVSTERTRASASALARGDAKRAQDLADQAITAEDWAASPYAARALATERLGDLAGASRDAQQAIDREPVNWRSRLLMARILAEQGDRRGARAQLAAARRVAPLNPYLASVSPYMQQLNSLLRPGDGATKAPAGR